MARVGPQRQLQAGRYAHAKQYKRMRGAIRSLRTWLGRVIRDVERKAVAPSPQLAQILARAKRLHAQKRDDKDKLYAWHAPEVECIAKGKARHPYEFGVKVSLAVTAKEGFVVGARSMPGNPYDGHTLGEQLEQVETLTGVRPKQAFVDRGYRGADVPEGCTMYVSGQKRGVTAALKRWIKRRSAIEPHIGPHEERWPAWALSPQRSRGRRDACRVVRCRSQPAPVAEPPAGFFASALGQHPWFVLRTDFLDISWRRNALTHVDLNCRATV